MDENAYGSDDALLRRFKGGDDSAIEVLYQRYAASFYKLTRVKGFKHEDADDIVQASFLKIVSGIRKASRSLNSFQTIKTLLAPKNNRMLLTLSRLTLIQF